MTQRAEPGADPIGSTVYQIRLRGQLDHLWSDWFEGLAITWDDNGDTLLTGSVADQSALYGLLRKIRDLGVTLVSVNRLDASAEPDQVAQRDGRGLTWRHRR